MTRNAIEVGWLGERILYEFDERLLEVLDALDLSIYVVEERSITRLKPGILENIRIDKDDIVLGIKIEGEVIETFRENKKNIRIAGPWYLDDIFEGLEIDYINSVGFR